MGSLEPKPTGRRIQIQALVKEFHAPGLGLTPEPGQNHREVTPKSLALIL